jgi:putative spermidine/putrescine transport system ATP-binding protein
MLLRPERLRILDGSESEAMNRFEGHVQSAIYQGDTLLLQIVLNDGSPVTLRMPTRGDDAPSPAGGSPITVGIAVGDTVLLTDEARAKA